ncbi:MAG: ABC transporter permease, partial [Synergistales bacterium]|nr:ABC transporter permease [Synergistales bacterium]
MTAAKKPKTSGASLRYEAWLRFRRNRLAMAGLVMAVTVILGAVFASSLAPYDPFKQL